MPLRDCRPAGVVTAPDPLSRGGGGALRPWVRLLPWLGFLIYAAFLASHVGGHAGGADSSGYLNNARLLSEGRWTAAVRPLPGLAPDALPPYALVPLGFIPNPDHVTLTPTYPMGLPLLIAGAAAVAGWTLAPGLVMVLHALLGVALVYLIGRQAGLEPGWAWLGSLALASSPLYLMMSVPPMSDVPALVWVTAAVLAAWRSRQRPWLALAGGVALSLAVLIRPSDLLALLPVLLALGRSPRRWILLVLGGLPGAVFQAAFNLADYGHLLTTGYGHVISEFGWANVLPSLSVYVGWLPVTLTPLVLLVFGLPSVRIRPTFAGPVLALWALVFAVFYLFYAPTSDFWWSLRFLLPAFPAFIVGSLLVARELAARRWGVVSARWLIAAGAAILLHGAAWARHQHATLDFERDYSETAAWLLQHVPPNSIVAAMQASGSLFYHTKFTLVRWDEVSPADFRRIAAACAAARRPVYAVLFPFERQGPEPDAFGRHLPGHWTQVGAVRTVGIWRLDPVAAP